MHLPSRPLILAALIGAGVAGCSSVQLSGPLPAPSETVGPVPPLELAWSYDAEAAFGAAPAIIRGDVLLFGTRQGELLALEVGADVRSRGRVELGEAIEGRPATDGRVAYVPVATGDKGVRAYDLTKGSTVWTRRDGPHTAGLVLDEQNGMLVAASHAGVLRGLDPTTGEEVWQFSPDSAFAAVTGGRHYRSTPALLPSGIVAAADDKGLLTASDVRTGRLAWSHDLGSPVLADLVATDDLLLVSTMDGELVAFSLDGEVRWRHTAEPGVKLSSAGVGEGLVAIGGTDGKLRALDAATGRPRWTYLNDGALTAAPAVVASGGRTVVYAGTMDKQIIGVDADSGEPVWESEVEGRIKTAPVITPGGLVFFREPSEVMMFRNAPVAAN